MFHPIEFEDRVNVFTAVYFESFEHGGQVLASRWPGMIFYMAGLCEHPQNSTIISLESDER